MGAYCEIFSPEADIASLHFQPLILNDMPVVTEEDRAKVKKATSTVFSGTDTFSNVASCQCGKLRKGYLLGQICPECNTPVTESFSDKLDYLVLIRSPNGVAPLILPMVLYMLMKSTTEDGFCYVRWAIDPSYSTAKASHTYIVEELLRLGLTRSYNDFVNRFDEYMDIISRFIYRKRAGGRKDINPNDGATRRLMEMMELLANIRPTIFTHMLPLPNRIALLMEQTSSGTYVGTSAPLLSDVIKSFQGIDTEMRSMTPRKKEARTATSLITLATYYFEEIRNNHGKKPGTYRRHIYGTRVDYSMRCVISSITEPHEYDQIQLPWKASVGMFSIHILNKLFKRGYTINKALKELYYASYHVTDLVSSIFDELFREAPNGFIYVYFNRNPSLKRGSCQRLKVLGIKKDIEDITIGLSVLNTSPFNADFDGDQMNLYMPQDAFVADLLNRLDPHLNLPNDDAVLAFSSLANLPRPAICSIGAWYDDKEDEDPQLDNTAFVQELLQRYTNTRSITN